MSAASTAMRFGASRRYGASGTGASATRPVTGGAAGTGCWASSRRGCVVRSTSTAAVARGAARARRSTSLPCMTASPGCLASYNGKHNEVNGEGNRDGTDDNRSWNCGIEGPTTDLDVLALRARQQRAFLTTLLLSAGVPTLLGGDEVGRTQRGNNNAYRQDNDITWFDWSTIYYDLLLFTTGSSGRGAVTGIPAPAFPHRLRRADRRWFAGSATEMSDQNWADPMARSVALWIDGSTDPDVDADGTPAL